MGGALARFLCIELRVSDFGWGLGGPDCFSGLLQKRNAPQTLRFTGRR